MIPKVFSSSLLRLTIWKFRKEFIWVGICSMIANILMLSPTIYMLQIFDRIMASRSVLSLVSITGILIWFFIIIAFSEWLRTRLLVRAGIQFDALLSTMIFRASFKANMQKAGYQPTEALTDLTHIRQFITGNGVLAFFDLPWMPFYVLVAFMIHPFLGWVSLCFICIHLGMAWLNQHIAAEAVEESIKAVRDDNKLINNKLRNAETIDAMGMHGNLMRYWFVVHSDTLKTSNIAHDIQKRQQSITKFVQYIMQSLTLAAGALLVIRGELSVGSMVASNLVVSRALAPMSMMVGTYKQYAQARIAFYRLEKLLTDFSDILVGEKRGIAVSNVDVKHLTTRVPEQETLILNDINLEFRAGRVTAIIGPSGSGKSTLLKCVVGTWPSYEGEVLLSGVPISQWDHQELGGYVGYLPQDVELMEGSIADNIARFGELDSEAIIQAANLTGIHDMILRMPGGYDLQIGQAGALLSGGQRQRIALARAIYGKSRLIVLDEPNSNLDEAGERSLVKLINELKSQGKTVILVTHKLNILSVVDDLIVLEMGQVLMQGDRDVVMRALKQRKEQKVA